MEPEDQDAPERDEWELVFPFVVCASNGGPFDDDAFTAGYQAAVVDGRLRVATAIGADEVRATVDTRVVPQLTLIAMHHGFHHIATQFAVTEAGEVPEWTDVTFRVGADPDA